SALATSVLMKLFGEAGIAYATLGVTLLVLIFAEVMPKTYALLYTDRVALMVAPVVAVLVAVFSPATKMISRLVNGVFRLFGVDHDVHTFAAQEEELRGAIDLLGENAIDETGEGQEKRAMPRS